MMQADQEKTVGHVRALRETHREPVVHKHGGRVLKRLGDGWIIAFGSISACVDCAMDVQGRMQSVKGVELRIGCHFGDIVEEDEDIYGSGVNIAERIQTEAPPGGFMVSEDVVRQLSGSRAEAMKDAGVFSLKNILQPVRLFQWRPAQQRGGNIGAATSIAVAAIDHAPLDAETAALAGDLRDQLIVRMSRRVGVEVYDAASRPVEEATYDLRSRLRVSGQRGRFSLSLVLRENGRPVWSESYDRSTEDIFDFCDVVLERAEADLRLQTNAFDGDRLADIPDDALSVSELRARAANLYYRVTYESWTHGRDLMNRALTMNPADGIAICMRIEAEIMLAYARYEHVSDDLIDRFARDLDKAVEDLPGSDYVFWTRGTFRAHCVGDIAGARADLANTKRINPAYMEAHELEGHILMAEGNHLAASERFDLLLHRQTHNPMIPYRLFLKACALYCAERGGGE
jgi:TolB-like protein